MRRLRLLLRGGVALSRFLRGRGFRLRRKARRTMIQEDIRRQQKERAKAKMRAKREAEGS